MQTDPTKRHGKCFPSEELRKNPTPRAPRTLHFPLSSRPTSNAFKTQEAHAAQNKHSTVAVFSVPACKQRRCAHSCEYSTVPENLLPVALFQDHITCVRMRVVQQSDTDDAEQKPTELTFHHPVWSLEYSGPHSY